MFAILNYLLHIKYLIIREKHFIFTSVMDDQIMIKTFKHFILQFNSMMKKKYRVKNFLKISITYLTLKIKKC